MRSPKMEIYRDADNEWRWRLQAANGRVVADSGEGYTTRSSAERAAIGVLDAARNNKTALVIQHG